VFDRNVPTRSLLYAQTGGESAKERATFGARWCCYSRGSACLPATDGVASRSMRVALFTETFLPKIDGIVTVICLLLDHLEMRGIDAVVVAPKMGVDHYRNTPVIGVPGVRFP